MNIDFNLADTENMYHALMLMIDKKLEDCYEFYQSVDSKPETSLLEDLNIEDCYNACCEMSATICDFESYLYTLKKFDSDMYKTRKIQFDKGKKFVNYAINYYTKIMEKAESIGAVRYADSDSFKNI